MISNNNLWKSLKDTSLFHSRGKSLHSTIPVDLPCGVQIIIRFDDLHFLWRSSIVIVFLQTLLAFCVCHTHDSMYLSLHASDFIRKAQVEKIYYWCRHNQFQFSNSAAHTYLWWISHNSLFIWNSEVHIDPLWTGSVLLCRGPPPHVSHNIWLPVITKC